MRAASSHAAGIDDSVAQRTLDGKRFELRLRFGCSEAEPEESRGWRFDEARRTLRLRVANDLSAEDPLIAAAAGDAESVEGLWLRRPWLLTASCPRPVAAPASDAEDEAEEAENAVAAASAAPRAPAAPRIGVAQFFSAADARTARREQRPYEATVVLGEGQRPSDQGYNFVVSGRLRALPNRRVISCSSQDADAPPDCVISVRIDRTWIERPDTGELLAEWHGG